MNVEEFKKKRYAKSNLKDSVNSSEELIGFYCWAIMRERCVRTYYLHKLLNERHVQRRCMILYMKFSRFIFLVAV